jgi:hypothetical protein
MNETMVIDEMINMFISIVLMKIHKTRLDQWYKQEQMKMGQSLRMKDERWEKERIW